MSQAYKLMQLKHICTDQQFINSEEGLITWLEIGKQLNKLINMHKPLFYIVTSESAHSKTLSGTVVYII